MVYELRKVGTSAADLKFLHRKRRNEPRDFKSKSGTRVMNLLVPMAFRSSQKVIAEMVYELRKVGTSAADLKSLHRKRRNEPKDFKSKSGTRIINLLVPMAFRSSQKVIAEMV